MNFEDIINLKSGTKVWCKLKYKDSDIFTVKHLHYGINFFKYTENDERYWISFFIDFLTLKSDIKNHIISIYEWISEEEYIKNRLSILRNEIDIILNMNNKEAFLK